MNNKLNCMKCIHLNPEKDNIERYFYKRSFHHLLAQAKLNGIRALWRAQDGLYTRNNNLITSVPHIVEELNLFFSAIDLDGELFHPTIPFNDINGASRSIKPTSNSLKLEYHVFDRLVEDIPQSYRLACNKYDLSELPRNSFIKRVPTNEVTPRHLDFVLRRYLKQGFEGMIIRAQDAFYKPGRHVGNLWAIKPTYEVEAMFLGFLPPGEETSLHQATFGSLLLKLPNNGRTFSCSGLTEEAREKLWNDPPPEGTWITIKFGAWSSNHPEKAVPLFPRFKCVRWDT